MDIVKKRRTRSYDANMKKKIVVYAEEHGNRAAGRAFNIPESCIRLWRKRKMENELSATHDANKPAVQEGVLSEMENTINIPATDTTSNTMTTVTAGAQTAEKVVSVSKLEWPQFLDSVLCEYITDLRKAVQPIPIELILLKAQDVAISHNIPRFQFEATRDWVRKFIQQKMQSVISTTRVMSVEFEKRLAVYKNFINHLQKHNDYSLNQIGNANEVPLLLNTSSICDKDLTVMLCATADGRKLPPFIIFRHENVLKKNFPHDVIVRTQKEGHMTPELMLDWYRIVWCCRPGVELNPRAILTLDASMSHLLTEDWLSDGNTDLVVIPSGSASIPQPVNLYINNAFKEKFRYHCEKWLQSQGKLKSASPSLLTYWISAAWKAVSKETISMSFKKCCLINTQEGETEIRSLSGSQDEYIVPCSRTVAAKSRGTGTQTNKLESKLNISSTSSNVIQLYGINQNEEPISLVLPDEENEIQDPLDMDSTSEDVVLNDALVKKEIKAELGETDNME